MSHKSAENIYTLTLFCVLLLRLGKFFVFGRGISAGRFREEWLTHAKSLMPNYVISPHPKFPPLQGVEDDPLDIEEGVEDDSFAG